MIGTISEQLHFDFGDSHLGLTEKIEYMVELLDNNMIHRDHEYEVNQELKKEMLDYGLIIPYSAGIVHNGNGILVTGNSGIDPDCAAYFAFQKFPSEYKIIHNYSPLVFRPSGDFQTLLCHDDPEDRDSEPGMRCVRLYKNFHSGNTSECYPLKTIICIVDFEKQPSGLILDKYWKMISNFPRDSNTLKEAVRLLLNGTDYDDVQQEYASARLFSTDIDILFLPR